MRKMLDQLLATCKSYINSLLDGYSTTEKSLANFEKEYMERYSGDRAVDHVLFRKFLRHYDPQNIEDGIAGNVINIYKERIEELESENEELRKKLAEVEQLTYAGL